jgi:predicted nucleic acid-binding protein
MLYVLDSTVLIDYLRGRPVVDRLESLRVRHDVLATTAINVEEIIRGLLQHEGNAATRLFDGLVVLSIDQAAAWQAGEWRRRYARRGITLSQADCLIGAAASLAGATLITGNPKHFPAADIDVAHWPVGT